MSPRSGRRAESRARSDRCCDFGADGGADGITVHLREDRRHIQDRDVRLLKPIVPRLNLEMAVAEEIVAIACEIQPHEATLVPEKRQELTTEGGLDVVGNEKAVAAVVKRLQDAGIVVSLFIDPEVAQIDCSKFLGAKAVEIQTAKYSEANSENAVARELEALRLACSRRFQGVGRASWARPHLPQCRRGRPAARRAGTQYRAQHRESRGARRHGAGRARNERSNSLLIHRRNRIVGRDDHALQPATVAQERHARRNANW